MKETNRVFLLSPAHCGGERARLLLSGRGNFELAFRLQSKRPAALGEVFSFLSGLYFRGKIVYARAFARPPAGTPGAMVITPTRGLLSADEPVTLDDLRGFAEVDIDANDPRYRRPLERDAAELALAVGPDADLVLLGSVASPKYIDVLAAIFGERLLFPEQFVGRGDMSRGGLLLRSAEAGQELEYIPVAGATLRGRRPPKLPRKR
ncbi:MAG TPA: hypothetical protein VGV87_30615 [Blastocatellia bacterium]|nr:hypothetical protein [Blastocatellia bacterium]